MGTSKSYGGPPNGLLPDWIDQVAPGAAAPSAQDPAPVPDAPPGDLPPAAPPPGASAGPLTGASPAGGLGTARGNFTRFAGSRERDSLRRAVSQYVRQGTGGAAGAARRMGASRVTGAQLLGLIGDVQRNGPAAALQRLNLGGLAGRPAVEVFLALTEVMCPPGGRVDEAIARQAMLDTICDMADQGVGDFGSLTADQLTEFFLGYVIHTIEGRVMADLGHRAIEKPVSAEEAKLVQEDLHQFVDGHVRGHLGALLDRVHDLPESEISGLVDRIYRASFELVSATAGDVE